MYVFSTILLLGTNADWAGSIIFSNIGLNLEARILAIILYTVSKQDMGLKSPTLEAFKDLGTNTIVAWFNYFRIEPDLKNSLIAKHTSAPVVFQDFLKKQDE